MITEEQIEPHILRCIRPFLGQSLRQVTYACLLHEAELDQISAPDFYFGGEVVMQFDGTQDPLVITWDENAGWEEHFSVQARTTSAFNAGCLQPFDASCAPIWKPLIGQTLTCVEVLGFITSPQIIALQFSRGRILVGCGYRTTFGDGDDIIIRASGSAEIHPEIVLLHKEKECLTNRSSKLGNPAVTSMLNDDVINDESDRFTD